MNALKIPSIALAAALFAATAWRCRGPVPGRARRAPGHAVQPCAVVNETQVEKRKGKASGVGAVGGAVAGGVVGNKATDGGTSAPSAAPRSAACSATRSKSGSSGTTSGSPA